jgi:hypothetical protein
MKTTVLLLTYLLLAFLVSTTAFAGQPIAKCVNAQGELTFTDYFCETAEPGNNPLLMTEKAINPSVRAVIPSVVRANTITSGKLKSATTEAQAQCERQFVNYFKRRHPSLSSVPDIEFANVVDQFIKGPNVSISLAGLVEYTEGSYSVNSNIECTVQRFKANGDWMIGFREQQ